MRSPTKRLGFSRFCARTIGQAQLKTVSFLHCPNCKIHQSSESSHTPYDSLSVDVFWLLSPSAAPPQRQKVQRARPEEFIHIFVHQKPKLIEFLEHMTQVTLSWSRLISQLTAVYHRACEVINQNSFSSLWYDTNHARVCIALILVTLDNAVVV